MAITDRPIVVQKFGGSSLATLDKVQQVAQRISATIASGKRVVAVVSAMGKTTDGLLAQARQLSANPNARELDMLLSVGERISTALLSVALGELGHPAISLTGSQSGIITNTRHNRARIVEVRPYRVLDQLDAGKVVVVAGYQGVSYAREITTLGRGGTDTTAVALAAALDAVYCEICSDVDGVYTADPRVVSDARRLDDLGHAEMVALARSGARVLNQDCVEYASHHGVAIFAKSTFGPRDDTGTVVRLNPAAQPRAVTAIAHRLQLFEIALSPGHAPAELLGLLTASGALPSTITGGFRQPLYIVIPTDDAHRLPALRAELERRFGSDLRIRDDRGSVTLVGPGLGDAPEVVTHVARLGWELAPDDADLRLGPIEMSLTLPSDRVIEAVNSLHSAFIGPQ